MLTMYTIHSNDAETNFYACMIIPGCMLPETPRYLPNANANHAAILLVLPHRIDHRLSRACCSGSSGSAFKPKSLAKMFHEIAARRANI